MTSWWIDLVILAGLAAALIWGAVLARRIARLQAALLELAPALQAFCDAVDQSERSIEDIRRETDRMEQQAQRSTELQARAAITAPDPLPGKADRNDLVRRFFDAARGRNG